SMSLTIEGVLALAPDDASAKAARGLASAAQWPLLGANDAAAWGECKGSGAKPYQTQVDLSGPAFRCTCPSRKFPCKHGLALLMMRAQSVNLFAAKEAPAWVSEWLASRSEKAQKKEERQLEKAAAPADPQAAAKREAQRWQRIEGAAQELQRWLADQIARGLGSLSAEVLQGWQTMAARMVDAQAPGLGWRVREAANGINQGADWPERTLHALGLLQLACEALQRRSALSPALQADLRSVVGWPHDKAEVLADGERVADRWTVLGSVTEERDDKLSERRVWLHGERSGRRAWLLDHAFGGRGFELSWLTGSSVEATLAFFPGASALRALAAEAGGAAGPAIWPSAPLSDEWQRIAQRVALCPWVGWHPLVVADALPLRAGEQMLLIADGRALPLRLGDADSWKLLACSGGRPLQLAGEWDGHALQPLTAWRTDAVAPIWQRSAQ
ncbi:MAG TPA: SWIM zinc finger family protein, partial [Albitalea sp.]|nr:SWIM zinc finger family protein [Albitalea sp.]